MLAKRGFKMSSRSIHIGWMTSRGSPPTWNHSRFPVAFHTKNPSNKIIVKETTSTTNLARRGKADMSSHEALETRFRSLEKRWDDRTVYEKRLDDIGNGLGKRLDDFATRIVSSERGFLFLVVGLVGLFGVLTKQSADLNQKIDKQSADLNQKIDKQSADLNQKIDKLAASVHNMDKHLHIISTELRRLSSSHDDGHVPPTSNN
jgi:methyl-accepting chemotaxis protein